MQKCKKKKEKKRTGEKVSRENVYFGRPIMKRNYAVKKK